MDSVTLMRPVTKYSAAIPTPGATGEVVANAFRAAMTPRPGAAFIAFPQDVQGAMTDERELARVEVPAMGRRTGEPCRVCRAVRLTTARCPVVLTGHGSERTPCDGSG